MKLKEYLQRLKLAHGSQQKFLADKAGINPSAFNQYVLGKKIPNISTAWKIHKATNGEVTFQDWLEEIDIDANKCINKDDTKYKNHQRPKK